MRASVLIVEDHPLVAQGLRALIQKHHDVLDIVQDSRLVKRALLQYRPDLLLLDLSMPHLNGIEVLQQIRRRWKRLTVLVVTMHLDKDLADLAFKAGANGFVPKEASADELRQAIAAVLAGEQYLSPRVPRRGHWDADVLHNPKLERITARQLEILRLVAEGKTAAEIGDELGVSPRTVEFHRANIRRVLGISSEWGLVRFAVLAGLAGATVVPEPEGAPS